MKFTMEVRISVDSGQWIGGNGIKNCKGYFLHNHAKYLSCEFSLGEVQNLVNSNLLKECWRKLVTVNCEPIFYAIRCCVGLSV